MKEVGRKGGGGEGRDGVLWTAEEETLQRREEEMKE